MSSAMHDGGKLIAYLQSLFICTTNKDESSCFSHGEKENSNEAILTDNRYIQ